LFDYPSTPHLATVVPAVAKGNEQFASECVQREIEVITLTHLCEQYVMEQTIDFMSIDVEGHEKEVNGSGDWKRYRPRALVIEATFPHSTEPTHEDWEPILLNHDYRFAIFDGLNRFYVRDEDIDLLRLLRSPACIVDQYTTAEQQASLAKLQALAAEYQSLVAEHRTLRAQYQAIFAAPFQFLETLAARSNSFALSGGVGLACLLHGMARRTRSSAQWTRHVIRTLQQRGHGPSSRRGRPAA
jgi:hypothetical protein